MDARAQAWDTAGRSHRTQPGAAMYGTRSGAAMHGTRPGAAGRSHVWDTVGRRHAWDTAGRNHAWDTAGRSHGTRPGADMGHGRVHPRDRLEATVTRSAIFCFTAKWSRWSLSRPLVRVFSSSEFPNKLLFLVI